MDWFAIGRELSPKARGIVSLCSFLLPLAVWSAFSYLPFLWHPLMEVTESGDSRYFRPGMTVESEAFDQENARLSSKGSVGVKGFPANPVFLPAPHEVGKAFYTAFVTEPRRPGDPWLHESLWHSIQVIFWGFLLSSIIGVPLGILCGAYSPIARLFEPFIDFVRYMPAPAFGALAVAIVGIYDGPKIAIIFIGTFFQQVLVVANTTRGLDRALVEAAQTLGTGKFQLLTRVALPGILPDLYRDLRILLGWAWTYLIVAELVGAKTGITAFIDQQSKYKVYENVYAAIIMIGLIGLFMDIMLGALGSRLFPWEKGAKLGVLSSIAKALGFGKEAKFA